MATFDQAAADSALAAAKSAETSTKMAELILKKYGEFAGYTDQSIAGLRSEMQAADHGLADAMAEDKSELANALSATNKNIADNCVKWTDKATATKAGIMMVGANLTVDSAGKVSVPVATTSTLGVTRPGANMSVAAGVLTFSLANYRGAVDIGLADGSARITMTVNAIDIVAADNARMRVTGGSALGVLVNTGMYSVIRNNDIAQRGGFTCSNFSVDIGRSDLPTNLVGSGIAASGNLTVSNGKVVTG